MISSHVHRIAHRNVPSPVVVSACLLGVCCRFDGTSKPSDAVIEFVRNRYVIPVCSEQLGGLPTPRHRHEIVQGRVISEHGHDATDAFERGAREVLRIVELFSVRVMILKARSPSCGRGGVYDGTFSGRVVSGDGVLAALCVRSGCDVFTEEQLALASRVLQQLQ